MLLEGLFYYAAFCTLGVTLVLMYLLKEKISGWYHRRYWHRQRSKWNWPLVIYLAMAAAAMVILPLVSRR